MEAERGPERPPAERSSPGQTPEEGAEALAEFAALHGPALRASGVPERYWGRLLHKLEHEVFDAGEVFGIMQVEEVEEEEDEAAREVRKKQPNPGSELCYKVIVTRESGLQAANPNSIFLIDHAWTCRVEHARQQLQQVPGLLHRMANLMGIEFHGELPSAEAVALVLEEMWKFNQTYQLAHGTAEEKMPVWYIMDEFGSRIQHADVPSFATAPFFYMPQQVAYTLLWPLRDLDTGEEVTRDFAYGETDPLIRKCMLLPWAPTDMLDLSSCTPEPPAEHYQGVRYQPCMPWGYSAYPDTMLIQSWNPTPARPVRAGPPQSREPLLAGNTLGTYNSHPGCQEGPLPRGCRCGWVYTDVQQVASSLTHPRFTLTQSEADADILFNFSHFKDYRKLSQERPGVLLNQFPCENLLTVKDCLASIARRAGWPRGPSLAAPNLQPAHRAAPVCQLLPAAGEVAFAEAVLSTTAQLPGNPSSFPKPLPLTAPLCAHSAPKEKWATHFCRCVLGWHHLGTQAPGATQTALLLPRGEDNHWICKPWNLARSLDTHVTKSLHSIIRHRESTPKVVSKYIESPVLFLREDVGKVKFDVRYIVLLRSVKPLRLFVYDVFWLRFSNRAFALNDLDDYEKHFTVMNYDPDVVLKQVHCEEFIPEFEKQYPEFPWTDVQAEIFRAFTELFQVACAKPPPLGLCDYPSSRAMYAVDLMLKWDNGPHGKRVMQPQILEVNFNPDCERACRYHPTFFNDVFSTLFLDQPSGCHALQFLQKNSSKFHFRRTRMLPVSGAFHTRLMEPAVEPLTQVLKAIDIKKPLVSVYSNVHGHRYMHPSHIQKLLAQQVVSPVKWEQTMHAIYERKKGREFPQTFEVGPGKQLGAILKSCNMQAWKSYSAVDVLRTLEPVDLDPEEPPR
ncbi:hypothetical protein H8959_006797 [Pygathrix nigripes]